MPISSSTNARRRRLSQLASGTPTSEELTPGAEVLISRRRRLSQLAGGAAKEVGFSINSAGGAAGSMENDRDVTMGNVSLTYTCSTAPGSDPGGMQKDNQDSWVIKENYGGLSMMFLGVFDGHGYEGHKVSRSLVTRLPPMITASEHFKIGDFGEACSLTFPEMNKALTNMPGVDTELSGSTAVTAMLDGEGKLLVANVGDSRCVLGSVRRNGTLDTKALSNDHKPELPSEAERILAHEGRICSFMYDGEPIGPPRVWLKHQDLPGLCMTRSFGDGLAGTVGVIPEPEVLEYVLDNEDRYLLLMTDGIFEFIENEEIIEMTHNLIQKQGKTPKEAANVILKEAQKRWADEEDEVCDDCTIIIAELYINNED